MDLENIEKGGLFEVRIEEGIRNHNVVVAVMSRRSVEPDSVCRDEVVFALNEYKTVVPARIDPDPNVKPNLLLARRNWVDFSEDYDGAFDSLLRFLSGDEQALQPPRLPTVTGVMPIDFSIEIANFSKDFTGRHWFVADLDRWLGAGKERAFVVVADPGLGKSAIAASLTQRSDVVAIHFCTQQNSRSLDPQEFVASIVGQLHARLPGYDEAVEAKNPVIRRRCGADAFRELIIEPTIGLPPSRTPRLIVVDSLDEAATEPGETVVDVLAKQVRDLPPWLRVVTTTRPEEPIRRKIRTPEVKVYDLAADLQGNRNDLRQFIDCRFDRGLLKEELGPEREAIAAHIEELAEGIFLYARLVVEALESGELRAEDIGQLTPGLENFYTSSFDRRFADTEAYGGQVRPLLRALVVARGQVPLSLLRRVAGKAVEEVRSQLLALRPFLRINDQGNESAYRLFHKSMRDWLVEEQAAGVYWCEEAGGERQLADACWEEYRGGPQGMSSYSLAHLPAHLFAAGRVEDLAQVLTDLDFMEAKLDELGPQALIDDYKTALRSVEQTPIPWRDQEALRLLQGAIRLSTSALASDTSQLRGQLLGRLLGFDNEIICGVLERASRWCGGPWLRPLTASLQAPGGPLVRILMGHSDGISSVVVTPDGRRAVSASTDRTLRVWDLETGRSLRTLEGHSGEISSVAVTPDGRRAVSASTDRTLRVWDLETGRVYARSRGTWGRSRPWS